MEPGRHLLRVGRHAADDDGPAVALDLPIPGAPTLFGLLLVVGWLLGFLFGILQRILPFLAAMHKPPGVRVPRTPSSLTDDRPLAAHFHCHLAALALLCAAVVADSATLVSVAAGIGALGAFAFAAFFLTVVRRMRHPARAPRLDPGQDVEARRP